MLIRPDRMPPTLGILVVEGPLGEIEIAGKHEDDELYRPLVLDAEGRIELKPGDYRFGLPRGHEKYQVVPDRVTVFEGEEVAVSIKEKPKPGSRTPEAASNKLPNGWVIGEPVKLGPAINSKAGNFSPALSSDGLTMVFVSYRGGGQGKLDLWMSTRESPSDAFGEPVNLGPMVNTTWEEAGPALSADGLTVYFYSDRPGGEGGGDLWMSTRASLSDLFGEPVNLGPNVNSSTWEYNPGLSADGLTLIFQSRRPGGQGEDDLWMSTRASAGEPFGEPVNLGSPVNSHMSEIGPALSSDGLTLLFGSDRPGGCGDLDLWMSTRPSLADSFGEPTNLGPPVNTAAMEAGPFLTADGSTLYFHSHLPGEENHPEIWKAMITRPPPEPEPIALPNGWVFGEPVNLGPGVNSEGAEYSLALAPDGLTVMFSCYDSGSRHDLWMSTRQSLGGSFGERVKLGPPLNTEHHDAYPVLAADGLTLLFTSDRPGGVGAHDLWMSQRASSTDPFGEPVNLGPDVNSNSAEYNSTLSADGLTLVIESRRPGGQGEEDLWMSSRVSADEPFVKPVNLGSNINSEEWDGTPGLSPDGLTLLFSSKRAGGFGGVDIWLSTRAATADPFGKPVNLGPTVNTASDDGSPAFSADGSTLLFDSNRPGGVGSFDLWMAKITRPPREDGALQFDGRRVRNVSSYVEIPSFKYDGSHPITVDATVQILGVVAHEEQIFRFGGLTFKRDWDAEAGKRRLRMYLQHANSNQDHHATCALDSLPAGPHHFSGVWDGVQFRFYVDGKLVSEGWATDGASVPATEPPASCLGRSLLDDSEKFASFHGTIDEVRISKVACYTENFTPAERFEPDEHTLALYHFDEGTGDVLHDSSGNGHHGKVVGARWMRLEEP